MITLKNGFAAAAIALALPMATVSSSQAAPLAGQSVIAAHASTNNSLVTEVQWRRRGYYYGGAAAGVGIGLAAGALIGGAIAAGSSPYYYGPGYYAPPPAYYVRPAPVYSGDAVAYCMQRYRSYDPVSGTYLNYDGNRYPCP